jgi:hypothetical protein
MGGLVWVASYPKSGNTWTRTFLHNLLRGEVDINRMNLLTTWDSRKVWYQQLLESPLKDCTKDEVAAVRLQANQHIADQTDDMVFVKTHNAMVADRGTPMINPKVTAGAIYIVRNPLDVAISYSHHLSKSIDETIKLMNLQGMQNQNSEKMAYEVQGAWWENVYSWTRKTNPALFVMRYEDMLEKPLTIFSDLARFLMLKVSRKQVEDAIEASSFERLKSQEDEHGFMEKPEKAKRFFREGSKDQWQNVLSKSQVDAVINANRVQMARFRYLPYGY